ncbi:MAG: BamA/TamA family outer membrane protein [Phycisphaeraceae bacterium]|nr:MAG: BamA/TamA family outer membrane protein [Phycisphaeraceae bacterium]
MLAGAATAAGAHRALGAPIPVQPGADAAGDYENRPIREVVLRQPVKARDGTAGFGTLEASLAQLVDNQLRTRAGSAYAEATVSDDIGRLNRLARFRTIDARVQSLGDGSVRVVFTLEPQPIIADVQVSGNKKISDQEIAREVDVLVGTPIDEWEIDRSARRIEGLYRKKGYYLARVRVNRDELDNANVVLFEVAEGERVRVMQLSFEGNASFRDGELRDAVKTREAGLFETGPLDEEALDRDVASLVKYYRDRGYLNARVDRRVRTAITGKEALVTFVIDEGERYTLRGVRVEYPDLARLFGTETEAREWAGEHGSVRRAGGADGDVWAGQAVGPFSADQVRGLMLIKSGDAYSSVQLDRSMEILRSAFGRLGYTDVQLERRELRDEREPFVDVLVVVRRLGEVYKTGEVIITGNTVTKDKVIRRVITLQPERPLDMTQVEESRRRVGQSRFFEGDSVKVSVQREDPLNPGYRDVVVEVAETNTGSLVLGGTVGSDLGATAQISVRERNFDVADVPETWEELLSGRAFRGAGQSFSIDLLPGNRTQNYSISLSDPYFFETNNSLGGSVFYRARDYREYDEQRFGAVVNLGRRLGDRWRLVAPIRIENVQLSDINPSSPVDYFEVEEAKTITAAGILATRNTYDNPNIPTRGTQIELGLEQAGVLGGDFEYTVLKAEHTVFLTVYEDFFTNKTVLSFKTKVNYVPQGSGSVPVFDRFYLGGNSFRGFSLRTISPRGIRADTLTLGNEPVGGSFLFFWGAELQQPIATDAVKLAFFTDTGTVSDGVSFDAYRVSVGTGIRISVPGLSPVPLAFDFGFPIMKEPGDRKRLFSFYVDIPY